MPEPARRFVIGVDVGTASARAGVFGLDGALIGSDRRAITVFRESGSIVEQSSEEIWRSVCDAVRGAVAVAGVSIEEIAGIGFDATCSLVVLGEGGVPLPVGDQGRPERDIIVWMDHRAVEQAQRITAGNYEVLRYVGGTISPEMQTPKLLWLKENLRATFDRAWQFFDLTDFLTWRSTGSLARSSCTVTCKWTYLAHEQRWGPDYFRGIGLGELAEDGFARIGRDVVAPGTALGNGLTEGAATDLGLAAGTPVAAGLIDAHAGGLGTVGAIGDPIENLAYVFGTSSCTMTTTPRPVFVPGVWGPYYSAMVPDAWLIEGGQSAAGAALDHLVTLHPAAPEAARAAAAEGVSLPAWLGRRASADQRHLSDVVQRAGGLHVVPEFLGNRAPHADPGARAIVAGLGLETDMESLVALYVAGLCGIGYGLRQIIEVQAEHGAAIQRIVISGGAGQSDLVRQLLADATGTPVVASGTEEPVLLGAAMLAAVAGGAFADTRQAMKTMSAAGVTLEPTSGAIRALHDARFAAFEQLQSVALTIRRA